jgi:hypothetical protein
MPPDPSALVAKVGIGHRNCGIERTMTTGRSRPQPGNFPSPDHLGDCINRADA